jgi:hypothetical protein
LVHHDGDPLSPLLFNNVADSRNVMVHKAQESSLIVCVIDNLIRNDVAILQYADDTIMCLKDDYDKDRNAKIHL